MTTVQLIMHLDGNVDNAFPWMSSSTTTTASPNTASPHDKNAPPPTPGWLPPTPGIPPTPGWIPPTPGGVPPTPGALVDPPRQAREGYEWVWYPDGFWAEREIGVGGVAESPSSRGSAGLDGKLRRWKGKSSKGSQGSVDLDQSLLVRRGSGSRRGSGGSSVGPFSPQPHTPFRTERELVQALQSSESSSGAEPFWGYPFHAMTPPSAERGNESGSSPASTVRGFRRGSWPDSQTIHEEEAEDETGSQGSAPPSSRLKARAKSKEVSKQCGWMDHVRR
ncbi:hypothetical protein CONLIGDRAFT_257981 [Coniochaeta ligniaria NRRL 30616]|uniref:Uncharacterized protein n=1 Tax=Coniochaeta ligniaria NRRL 30616 TaxID=1408157 RepID=A0A1J7IWT7_9PEZI|nr:hypothetical protein CONLIGDRAFT_257981 [Coniochaeta ligniaria NRRL 30616]